MGREALSFRAWSLGRRLLRPVVLAVLLLAASVSVAWRCASAALEPQGRAGILASAAIGQAGLIGGCFKPHEALLYLPAPALCQAGGHEGTESSHVPKTFLDMTPAELAKKVPEPKHLEPAENQEVLPQILAQVGATVVDFYDNLSNTTCTEHIVSTVDTPLKTLEAHYDVKFNYVALVKPGADKTRLQEFRTDSKGELVQLQPQDAPVTIGFVAMTVHFHPDYQMDSRFRYLGREVMEGKNTYVVAFAQRPEVARHVGGVEFEHKSAIIFLQGVAWIDPVSFRILRLRTDIQQPELSVDLRGETTQVEYSETTFKQSGKTMWLPREVTVRGQLSKYVFHNRHDYSDYRLFVVRTEENQKNP